MKKPTRGSARRLLVSVVVALAAALGACAPLPSSRDASSTAGGGGGGAAARAGWLSETHDAPATLAREDLAVRPTPQAERVDFRPPRTGVVFCTQCQ